MKKFYITMLCLAAMTCAQAMELTFWLGDKKIEPGTTAEFTEVTVDDYGDYKEVFMEPKIYLSSDIYSSSIKVTASCVSGQNIRLCCNGNCQTGKEVTKNDVTLRREERLDLQFEYIEELDAGVEVPTVVTRISAEDIYDEESRVDFVLVMGVEGASLNKVETGADVVVPVPGAVAYSVSATAPFAIYATDGTCAFESTVTGDGTVALQPGIYVYKLGNISGKILVK